MDLLLNHRLDELHSSYLLVPVMSRQAGFTLHAPKASEAQTVSRKYRGVGERSKARRKYALSYFEGIYALRSFAIYRYLAGTCRYLDFISMCLIEVLPDCKHLPYVNQYLVICTIV